MTIVGRYAADGADWVTPAGVRTGRGTPAFAGPRIILDTDIAGDCDDVGAIALLHALADLGECDILAMGVSTTCQYSPGALDAVNVWHGRQVPIGQYKGTVENSSVSSCGAPSANYVRPMYDDYPRDLGTTVPDVVDVYRQALHDADDGTVTFVTIGFLNAFAALLASPSDGIDSRTGIDLFAAKVGMVYTMGGQDGPEAEYNLRESPVAAEYVLGNCPVTIVLNPFEIGQNVITGTTNFDLIDHIVRFAYDIHDGGSWVDTSEGHFSWDLTTVLQAVRGDGPWFTRERGVLTIDTSTGVDTWAADPYGPHEYTSLVSGQASSVEGVIEPLMWSPQAGV